eukprot:CAMPEP_0183371100 /NCGR_PEP_ID=MMETSP0164_2-20130417/104379_1 /TAXON_ID=221442 /ORGANISM="Coccolithus pelagicus ssp braarudi, Strain PLY182g" /LENGTH=62 /DNA_ID=CAMNT_0025547599 /DNA_START=428 /DNA_END=612 /DNA_ORIENTATION=-
MASAWRAPLILEFANRAVRPPAVETHETGRRRVAHAQRVVRRHVGEPSICAELASEAEEEAA